MNADTTALKPNLEVAITLKPVDSNQIALMGYDAPSLTMALQFKPRAGEAEGSIYRYGGVPPEVYERFWNAESKGKFFYGNIRYETEKYPFAKTADAVLAGAEDQAAA